MNNYLVIFSAHIDSDNKFNQAIKTLEHLKNTNVDVCLSTHSNYRINELSEYCKYVIYEPNNEFLEDTDYINNSDLLDDNFFRYGHNTFYTTEQYGRLIDHFVWARHSKSAMTLFQNGIALARVKKYNWAVYLEYDIPIPLDGFRGLIDDKIQKLIDNDKLCFHYHVSPEHNSFLWGGFSIANVMGIFNSKLFNKQWSNSKREWIKTFGGAFFEGVVENIYKDAFGDKIIRTNIEDECLVEWGTNDWLSFNKFHTADVNNEARQFMLHLYPYKKSDSTYGVAIVSKNNLRELEIKNLIVDLDGIYIYNKPFIKSNLTYWFYDMLDISNYTDGKLTLTYTIDNKTTVETINISNLENLYNKLLKVEFK